MKNSIKIALFITFGLIYIVPLIWFDHIDPAFMPNAIYRDIFYYYVPIACVVLSVSILIFSIRKYFTNKDYKNRVLNLFGRFIYIKILFTVVGMPFILYLLICAQIEPSLKLWTYYKGDIEWHKRYELLEARQCGSDYELNCLRIKVQEIGSNNTEKFRWYDKKYELSNLEGRLIYLSGSKSIFGYNVDQIGW